MNCIDKSHETPEPATVRVHGPHGESDYCERHAQMYESIMDVLGASTRRIPMLALPDMLPCPFCGGAPTLERWPAGPYGAQMVVCKNDCSVAPGAHARNAQTAVAIWNRRAPIDAPVLTASPKE